MRTGPGQMPVFGEDTFTDKQATDIAAYVTGTLQHPDDRGGFPLGVDRAGPRGLRGLDGRDRHHRRGAALDRARATGSPCLSRASRPPGCR